MFLDFKKTQSTNKLMFFTLIFMILSQAWNYDVRLYVTWIYKYKYI